MINIDTKMKYLFAAMVCVLSMAKAQPTLAQNELEVEGDVAFVTNYSLRGLSRSGGGVAVQGNLYIFSDNGFSAGVFASTLDRDFFGHEGEVEFYVDYGGTIGAYDYKLSAAFDTFHGSNNSTGYANFKASLARDFGRAYVNVGSSYSPSNREIGLGSSVYGYMDVDVPISLSNVPNLSFGLHAGYEDYEGPLAKWDWRAGLYLGVLDYELGLQYDGSDNDAIIGSGERVMLSLKAYF